MIVKLIVKVLILREELSDVRDVEKEKEEEENKYKGTESAHTNGGPNISNDDKSPSSIEEKKRK